MYAEFQIDGLMEYGNFADRTNFAYLFDYLI